MLEQTVSMSNKCHAKQLNIPDIIIFYLIIIICTEKYANSIMISDMEKCLIVNFQK